MGGAPLLLACLPPAVGGLFASVGVPLGTFPAEAAAAEMTVGNKEARARERDTHPQRPCWAAPSPLGYEDPIEDGGRPVGRGQSDHVFEDVEDCPGLRIRADQPSLQEGGPLLLQGLLAAQVSLEMAGHLSGQGQSPPPLSTRAHWMGGAEAWVLSCGHAQKGEDQGPLHAEGNQRLSPQAEDAPCPRGHPDTSGLPCTPGRRVAPSPSHRSHTPEPSP